MQTWIALLRGINVGGKHIVPMKELIRLMEANGFSEVKTYIQSGNVVFQHAERKEVEIAGLIEENFGFRPSVFVLSKDELQKASAQNPYDPDTGKAVHFFFFKEEPKDVDQDLLKSLKADSEAYKLVDKVFYLHAPNGIGRSRLVAKLHKVFPGTVITARNLNTINKLLGMIS